MEGTPAAEAGEASQNRGQGKTSHIFFLVLEAHKKCGRHKGGKSCGLDAPWEWKKGG